ncbi:MAG TPA: helix-turn-helix domain-containing protein, partial [Thermomicrobiales bacterium]|nr:helix-turn-helix domain-containing protein [Thermomicrobiales bacterium]
MTSFRQAVWRLTLPALLYYQSTIMLAALFALAPIFRRTGRAGQARLMTRRTAREQDMDATDHSLAQPSTASLTVTEAADRLGLTRWTISGWIASGALPAVVLAGRRRLRAEDVDAAQALVHAGDVVPAWRREPRRGGWRLRQLREAAELTQIELAARCGLTHEAISRLEMGRAAPLATSVRRLARALGVAPADFVSDIATDRGVTTAEAAARL